MTPVLNNAVIDWAHGEAGLDIDDELCLRGKIFHCVG